jgi:hypothetical protein
MKHIKISREESFKYMHSNKLENLDVKYLCGCCVLKEVITLTDSGNNYFALERFDGARYIVSADDLLGMERIWKKDRTLERSYDIANVYYDSYFNCHIKKHYSRASYIPTAMSIVNYIRLYWKEFSDIHPMLDYRDINIKAVNLTKAQMESLKAKINLLGVLWLQVDYNTIAVARTKEYVDIYTQQKTVKTFGEFNEDNMLEELSVTF